MVQNHLSLGWGGNTSLTDCYTSAAHHLHHTWNMYKERCCLCLQWRYLSLFNAFTLVHAQSRRGSHAWSVGVLRCSSTFKPGACPIWEGSELCVYIGITRTALISWSIFWNMKVFLLQCVLILIHSHSITCCMLCHGSEVDLIMLFFLQQLLTSSKVLSSQGEPALILEKKMARLYFMGLPFLWKFPQKFPGKNGVIGINYRKNRHCSVGSRPIHSAEHTKMWNLYRDSMQQHI